MQEKVFDTNILPPPFPQLIATDKFSYRKEKNGAITLFPAAPDMGVRTDDATGTRIKWLERLEASIDAGADEDFCIPPRSKEMRAPHGLTD